MVDSGVSGDLGGRPPLEVSSELRAFLRQCDANRAADWYFTRPLTPFRDALWMALSGRESELPAVARAVGVDAGAINWLKSGNTLLARFMTTAARDGRLEALVDALLALQRLPPSAPSAVAMAEPTAEVATSLAAADAARALPVPGSTVPLALVAFRSRLAGALAGREDEVVALARDLGIAVGEVTWQTSSEAALFELMRRQAARGQLQELVSALRELATREPSATQLPVPEVSPAARAALQAEDAQRPRRVTSEPVRDLAAALGNAFAARELDLVQVASQVGLPTAHIVFDGSALNQVRATLDAAVSIGRAEAFVDAALAYLRGAYSMEWR